MSDFGQRLKELREKMSISQEELGKRFNLSQSTIAYYELNKKQPSQSTLGKIADFFDVKVDYILGRTDDQSPTKKSQNRVTEDAELEDILTKSDEQLLMYKATLPLEQQEQFDDKRKKINDVIRLVFMEELNENKKQK